MIPAALILLVAGLLLTMRKPRTDRTRAAFLLWGGWLVVTAAVFSFAQGIIHPYYTVALAPAIGALVGMGSVLLWRTRSSWFSRLFLAAALAVTSVVSYRLLLRSPDWHPTLRTLVLVVGLVAAAGIAFVPRVWKAAAVVFAGAGHRRRAGRAGRVLPRHRDDTARRRDPFCRSRGDRWRRVRRRVGSATSALPAALATSPASARPRWPPAGSLPGPAGGAPPGSEFGGPGAGSRPAAGTGGPAGGFSQRDDAVGRARDRVAGERERLHVGRGDGELELRGRLPARDRRSGHGDRWLQRHRPVADARAVRAVRERRQDPLLHRGGFGGGGAGAAAADPRRPSQITTWVQSHFTAQTIGGTTVYDLSAPN